ncbi:MAG: hypothetical protein EOM68_31880, partial [Spirochaetia bacterium]|nr:hypothetical protein [Spirochaetia bacterium]
MESRLSPIGLRLPGARTITAREERAMSNQPTIDLLKAMRFSAMATELQRQIESSESYSQLSFDERMSLLTNAEWTRRQNNKVARNIRDAHFAVPS